jgi:colanic acid/amylovoran biosynthesis glycosyltransferase
MKILIITSSFPYPPGEQFLESEIKFWNNSNFKNVTIIPEVAIGEPRVVPDSIRVSTQLAQSKKKYVYVIAALANPILYKEFGYLIKNKKINFRTAFSALKSTAHFLKARNGLSKFLIKNGPVDLIYTYWNSYYSYAACDAKNKKLVKKIVSRIHGFDLYEERCNINYMPLKRRFVS